MAITINSNYAFGNYSYVLLILFIITI